MLRLLDNTRRGERFGNKQWLFVPLLLLAFWAVGTVILASFTMNRLSERSSDAMRLIQRARMDDDAGQQRSTQGTAVKRKGSQDAESVVTDRRERTEEERTRPDSESVVSHQNGTKSTQPVEVPAIGVQKSAQAAVPKITNVLEGILSSGFGKVNTNSLEWQKKLGSCSDRGWPAPVTLDSEGSRIQLHIVDVEEEHDVNKLRILVLAVMNNETDSSKSTTNARDLLERVLPSLRCDFRKGNEALHSSYRPFARTPVEMTVLATSDDDNDRHMVARLTCNLPELDIVVNVKGLLVPNRKSVQKMSHEERAADIKRNWLHWQLFLDSSVADSESNNKSWLAAPSLPLCDLRDIRFRRRVNDQVLEKLEYVGSNADRYYARGDAVVEHFKEGVEAVLCVAPSWSASLLQNWSDSAIRDWLFYQLEVVGFAGVIYLDPFGDELWVTHPGLSMAMPGMEFVYAPHTATHWSTAMLMRDGKIAEALTKERCSILARQRDIPYVLRVADPMDLVVPMQRRRMLLREVLTRAMCRGSEESVPLPQISLSVGGEDSFKQDVVCDEEWCTASFPADVISEFLMSVHPLAIQEAETSNFHFWRADSNSPDRQLCERYTLRFEQDEQPQVVRLLSQPAATRLDHQHLSDDMQDAVLEQTLLGLGTWVRSLLKTRQHLIPNPVGVQQQRSGSSWVSAPSSGSMPVRTCRALDDRGPTYGEAWVLNARSLFPETSSKHQIVRLQFFDAEISTSFSHSSAPVMSMSVYANVQEARPMDKHVFGNVSMSERLDDISSGLRCLFLHPDSFERMATHDDEFPTEARWRSSENGFLRLECPLPQLIASPGPWGMSSLVIIENEDAPPTVHMIRPVQLCMGAEAKGDLTMRQSQRTCDGVSIACQVGCIDDRRALSDPIARCCERCHNPHDPYQRFDERDFWTPEAAATVSHRQAGAGPASSSGLLGQNGSIDQYMSVDTANQSNVTTEPSSILPSGDMSICLAAEPFFLQTKRCTGCDETDDLAAQRFVEWIEYHLLIGFDVIYILDRSGSLLRTLLEPYITAGRIIYQRFPLLSIPPMHRFDERSHRDTSLEETLAYQYCLSIGRRRGDAFLTFIDTNTFVRFPSAEAGALRSVVGRLIAEHWESNATALPDAIVLDEYPVTAGKQGFFLGYTRRSHEAENRINGQPNLGRFLVQPKTTNIGIHAAFAESCSRGNCEGYLLAPTDKLALFRYQYPISTSSGEGKMDDHSLLWVHDIVSGQFIGTAGWRAMAALSNQGLLQPSSVRKFVPQDLRDEKPPSLFVGILSYCAAREKRDSVRRTWLSGEVLSKIEAVFRVDWRFVLGQTPVNEQSQRCTFESLEQEMADFGDLLLLENTTERYDMLDQKVLKMFKWIHDHQDVDFVFKADDDSYLNIPFLVASLLQVESPDAPLYLGDLSRLHVTHRLSSFEAGDVQWYVRPEDWWQDLQPFASGAGYLLSRSLVSHLAVVLQGSEDSLGRTDPKELLGGLEDVTLGYLLRRAMNRATRVTLMGFKDLWIPRKCECDFFTLVHHVMNDAQFTRVHDALSSKEPYSVGPNICEQLMYLHYRIPKLGVREHAEASRWSGPFLDRPVSPLLTMNTPPFEAGSNKDPMLYLQAPLGRDVIVVVGGFCSVGRYLVETIQSGYSRMSGPITVIILDSAILPEEANGTSGFDDLPNAVPGLDVKFKQIDTSNYDAILAELTPYRYRIRGVVHFVTISEVRDCHSNPRRCEEVNVGGTKIIVRALWSLYGQRSGLGDSHLSILPWLVFLSSTEVYGTLHAGVVADESLPLRPENAYGETMAKAESVLRRWTLRTGFNAVALRLAHVYGSCHDHEMQLVPRLVRHLLSDEVIEWRDERNKNISLIHVRDAVQAMILAMSFIGTLDNGAGGFEVFNIAGPANNVLDINDLYRIVQFSVAGLVPNCKLCHEPLAVSEATARQATEAGNFGYSIERAFRVLGFKPSKTFDGKTVQKIIETCSLVDPP